MISILFDATILVNGQENKCDRSGIYFTAQNILDQLLVRKDVRVTLFADVSKLYGLNKLTRYSNVEHYAEYAGLDKSLYCTTNLFRRKRFQFFTKPLIRKIFALSILIFENIHLLYKRKLIKTLQTIDSYNVYFSPLTAAPWYLQKNEKMKKFVFLHDVIPFKLDEYKKQRKGEWFGHLVNSLNGDDVYFANSQSTKKDFCELFAQLNPQNIAVTYLAASADFKRREEDALKRNLFEKYGLPQKRFIFSLCTLEPRKNVIRAVRSFVEFLKKTRADDIIFVLGGGSWHSFVDRIKKEIPEYKNFQDKIIFSGYIDDCDLPVFYSNAEWFVYTSQYEGFGLPLLEAMQCGCPVIASKSSSLPEVVGDAGIMIDWNSDEQHVDAYEQYYFNENVRKQNSCKGLERTKMFSWKKTVDSMIETFFRGFSSSSKSDLG